MRRVTVNGVAYISRPLNPVDVEPGVLLAGTLSRKAMRVVCIDGTDAILRNMRHPDLLEAEPISALPRYYERIYPFQGKGRDHA